MAKTNKGLPPNLKELMLPLLALSGAVVLIVVAIINGTDRISEQKKILAKTEKTESVLEEKESELRRTAGSLKPYINTASIALPEKNPVLYVIVQTRAHAENQNVTLGDFKINMGSGRGSTTTLSAVGIHTNITGSFVDVINYMKKAQDLAPITTVEKMKLSIKDMDNVSADVTMLAHWSNFPTEVPAVTTPINKITQEEIRVLQRLAGLIQPEFAILSPQVVDQRENPFAF